GAGGWPDGGARSHGFDWLMYRFAATAIDQTAALARRKSPTSSAAAVSAGARVIAATSSCEPGGTSRATSSGTTPSRYRATSETTRLTRLPIPCASSSLARAISPSLVKSTSPILGTSRSSHQRSASVPYSSVRATGSTAPPPDLLILAPSTVR